MIGSEKNMLLTERDVEEEAWIQKPTDHLYRALEFVDRYVNVTLLAPFIHCSSSSIRLSVFSTRARPLEAERRQKETEWKLQQIWKENEKRVQEDDLLQKNTSRRKAYQRRAEKAESEVVRQRLHTSVLRLQLHDQTVTPSPDMNQVSNMTSPNQNQ